MRPTTKKHLIGLGIVAAGVVVGAAAAAPDKLDPGFGEGGVVVTATAPGAGEDGQNGLAIQRDGRIVVGGSSDMGPAAGGHQWRISRYKSKGELDGTFGAGGTVTTRMSSAGGFDEHVWNLALQDDGKIVAAGDAITAAAGWDVALARFNADGTLDTSFGTAGKVTTAVGPGTRRDRAHDVAVLDDGKIIVAGFADMGPGAGGRNFMLARYDPDGSLDGTFGSGGIVLTAVAPGDNNDIVTTNGLMIDPAGRILVTGQANMGSGGAGGVNFALARYLPSGTLDSTFGTDGIVTTQLASGDNFDTLVGATIDEDGKIVTAGAADTGGFVFDLALVRYNPDGSLDASFGTGGEVTMNVGPGNTDDVLQDLVIQTSGRILVGGGVAAGMVEADGDFLVARFNPDARSTRRSGLAASLRRRRRRALPMTRSSTSRSGATRSSSPPASASNRRPAATSASPATRSAKPTRPALEARGTGLTRCSATRYTNDRASTNEWASWSGKLSKALPALHLQPLGLDTLLGSI